MTDVNSQPATDRARADDAADFLPLKDVPSYLQHRYGVRRPHLATVYRWVRQGRLKIAGHVGRQPLVRRDQIDQFVAMGPTR